MLHHDTVSKGHFDASRNINLLGPDIPHDELEWGNRHRRIHLQIVVGLWRCYAYLLTKEGICIIVTIGTICQISSISFWVGEQSLFSGPGQNFVFDHAAILPCST